MADAFRIRIQGGVPAALERARKALAEAGGGLSGDLEKGTFAGPSPVGRVEGEYVVKGATVQITITKKPFVLPASTVEKEVRAFFGDS
jgi:hypothetical protein